MPFLELLSLQQKRFEIFTLVCHWDKLSQGELHSVNIDTLFIGSNEERYLTIITNILYL